MRYAAITLVALSIEAIAAPSLAGWAGTWHLDRAASQFRGDPTRIVRMPQGYRFDLGPVSFIFPDDGALRPTVAGRETRLARLGDHRWEREHRIDGRIVDRSILAGSADGRTLTISGEHPGAAPERLVHEGTGTGLAGTWRSTRLGISASFNPKSDPEGDIQPRLRPSRQRPFVQLPPLQTLTSLPPKMRSRGRLKMK